MRQPISRPPLLPTPRPLTPRAPEVYGWVVARDKAARMLHRWIVATVVSTSCAALFGLILLVLALRALW